MYLCMYVYIGTGPYLNCSETTTSSSSTFSTSTPLKKSAPKSKWRSKKKQKIIVDDQTTITIITESSKKKGLSNDRSNVDSPSLLVADFPDCSKLSPVAKLHVETVSQQQNHQQLQQQNHQQQQLATSNQQQQFQQQFQQESQLQQQQQQQLEEQQNSPHHDLSSRKEMIEMLDCEITLDYLLRNGAINIEEFNQLREDEGSAPFYNYHYQDQDGDRDHHHHRRVGGGGDTDADVLAVDEGGETKKNGDDDDGDGDRKDDGKKKKKKGIKDKCSSSSSRKKQPESICNNNNENNKEAQPNKDTADFQLKQLEQHRQQMKRNKKLLEIIETRGLHGRNLFTNALRLTGQHFLANMADDGVRIRALSGSGYLSKSRHKGQVELYMRVKSVQSIDDETFKLVSRMLHKDWISLQDIQSKFSSLRRQQQQRNSALLNAQIIDHQQQQNNNKNNKKSFNNKRNNNNKNDDDDKGGCFCCCFGRNKMNGADDAVMFEKMKLNNLDDIVIVQQPTTTATTNKNSHGQEAVGLREDSFDHIDGGSVEDLKKVSDSIQRICQSVYDQFADNHSPLNAMLVRYFEQDRGVLMLETSTCNNKLLIKCICTKLDQVTSIDQDISSNRLATDVEKILTRFLQETAQDDERMTLEFKVAQGSLDEIKVELTN
ncbi:hypothetical protein HELRODRAFT_167210 [Helobdella robusta]|uniref:Uncharacterized protein n=1 Tax=Helobdella robusta TaxID=6412 RepID=T1EZ54_HELRO|nr:hypothetical protein HELRODRAFT_167210 [Helobdella robusta]ESO10716.1 hypothetical protein HELRODRAFT_167210 [Helobdella robusta]